MATEYKHKRYFQLWVNNNTGSVGEKNWLKQTFSSVADAKTKIGFTSVWDTSSPTKTEALADSDQTLTVTYEFDNLTDQTAFKNAIDGTYSAGNSPFSEETTSDRAENFKTEWFAGDGATVDSTFTDTDGITPVDV